MKYPRVGLILFAIGSLIGLATPQLALAGDGNKPFQLNRRQVVVGGVAAVAGISNTAPAIVEATSSDFWISEWGLKRSVKWITHSGKNTAGSNENLLKVFANKLVQLEMKLAAEFNLPRDVVRENLRLLVSDEQFLGTDGASMRPFFPRRFNRIGKEFEDEAIRNFELIDPHLANDARSNQNGGSGKWSGNATIDYSTRNALGLEGQRQIFWFDNKWMRACMFDEIRKVDPKAADHALFVSKFLYYKDMFAAATDESQWTYSMRLSLMQQIAAVTQDNVRMAPSKAITDMEFSLIKEWNISIDQLAEWVEGWRDPGRDLIWHKNYVRRAFPRPDENHRLEYIRQVEKVLPQLAFFFRTEPQRLERYIVDWDFMSPEKLRALKRDVWLHRDEEMKEKIEYFQKTGKEPQGSREWIQKALNTPSPQPQTPVPTLAQQPRADRIYRGLKELGHWWRNRTQQPSTRISAQPTIDTQTNACEVQLLSPPNPVDAPIPMEKMEEPELVPVRPK